MKRKQLWRVLGTGCLAASLLVSPMTGLSALAAGETGDDTGTTQADATDKKEGGSALKLDPTRTEAIPESGSEADGNYVPAKPAYADTEIPVWGWVEDAIVYSVDVEWGAMTFRYENSTWDPVNHVSIDGAGWQVYDSEAEEALEETEHAINEIKVTNHSNAGVWATLDYAGKQDGTTDYTGIKGTFSFTNGTETGDTNELTDAAADGSVSAYLTLTTANSNPGGTGAATVGKAYFMPTNPDPDKSETAPSDIEKWTQIGTITVGIKTEDPANP